MNLSACMFNLLYEKLAKSLSNSTDEQRLWQLAIVLIINCGLD